MDRYASRPIVVTAFVLVLVVPILVVAGLLVRGYVRSAFDAAEQVRAARVQAGDVLTLQLDKETGIRGFAATHDRAFLEPYRNARDRLGPAFGKLNASVRALKLPDAPSAVADARATSDAWHAEVARPLTAARPASPLIIQRRGKALMDHYRDDLRRVDAALAGREAALDADAERAIDRISLLVGFAIVVLAVLGIAYGVQQARLARRFATKESEATELRVAYETEKRVADSLQDAFLQRPLPTLPSVSFSATYVPATEEAKVGGDWYDGVELSRDRVMFAIGDVAGHGLEAAVAMNRARQALVSAAVLDPDPAHLLTRVNRELIKQNARMVTAVCGYADAQTYEFTYATAGHPPPVLIEPGFAPRILECGNLPLAVLDTAAYTSHTVQTVPGAMLVLYTDGAVEHSRDVLAGETTLLDAVARAIESEAPNIAAAIHNTIFEGREVGDDVAILTITFASNEAGAGERALGRSILAAAARESPPAGVAGTVVSLFDRMHRRSRSAVRAARRIAS